MPVDFQPRSLPASLLDSQECHSLAQILVGHNRTYTISCFYHNIIMHAGGFEWYVDPVPDLELWSRWTAAGAVSGLMHEQGGGKGTGKKSHIFDFPGGTAIWRKFAKFRTQLFPYIYTQAHIAHQVKKGIAIYLISYRERLILSLLRLVYLLCNITFSTSGMILKPSINVSRWPVNTTRFFES